MKQISIILLLTLSVMAIQAQEFEDLKQEAEKIAKKRNATFHWLDIDPPKGEKQKALTNRVLQFSIYKKLTTNGSNSKNISNNFSLNLTHGHNGALNGIEIGTIANIQERHSRGIQITGILNVAGAEQSGLHLAGFTNIAGGLQRGIQVSGITNIAGGIQSGIQVSGLANIAGGTSSGIQSAGLVNISGGKANGIQISGLANITGGKSSGIFVSGITNITGGATNGITIAGISNVAGSSNRGIGLAGITNVSSRCHGIFVAGISNVTKKGNGIFIGGISNRIKKARGLLIAPINKIDTLGVCIPIGLITIVKHDKLSQFEISGSETMHAQIAFRYGARKWYNIYSLGVQADGSNRWGAGLGFGSQWYLNSNKSISTNIEATTMQVNENEAWTNTLNLNNQFRISFSKKLGKWQAFAGATLNVLVSQYKDGETFGLLAPSYTIYEHSPSNDTHIRVWPGGVAGLRYSFGKN